MTYLINENDGSLKIDSVVLEGYLEITKDQNDILQKCNPKRRLAELQKMLPTIEEVKDEPFVPNKSTPQSTNGIILPDAVSDFEGIKSSKGLEGRDTGAGATTLSIDPETGNIDTIGKITANTASFTVKPTFPDAKGVMSPGATMSDVAEGAKGGIQHISSPGGTLKVNDTDKANSTLDVVPATAAQLGAVKPGTSLKIAIDGTLDYTLPIASNVALGGVKVIGGSSGVRIAPDGTVSVDPAIAPLDYLGTLDAAKNEGGDSKHKLVDEDNPDVYHGAFYVVAVPGTIQFTHGPEVFSEGDWALFEQFEGKAGGKWVSVPVGKYQSVHSVNGKIGTVVLTAADIGLGNVKNVDQTNADNIITGTLKMGVNTTQDITGKAITATGPLTANVGGTISGGKLVFTKSA